MIGRTHSLPLLLRSNEVAAILQLPRQRVCVLARKGLLPAIRVGRQFRFDPEKLRQFCAEGGQGYGSAPLSPGTGESVRYEHGE